MRDQDEPTVTLRVADPDPIAIMTIAFAGVAMLSGVATTLFQGLELRRRGREEDISRQERIADVVVAMDRVVGAGRHLVESIDALERNAAIAISFSHRARAFARNESQKPHFAFGENVVSVSGSSRELWDLLVDDVCNNVRLVNRFVLEFTEHLGLLFERLRHLEMEPGVELEGGLLEYARGRAHRFQTTVAKFQALTSKTPLPRAQQVFSDVCAEGRDLVQVIDRVIERSRRQLR
jgi:hypothetical protein